MSLMLLKNLKITQLLLLPNLKITQLFLLPPAYLTIADYSVILEIQHVSNIQ